MANRQYKDSVFRARDYAKEPAFRKQMFHEYHLDKK